MKKVFTLAICLISCFSYSQTRQICDTVSAITNFDFEQPSSSISISNDTGNIWQICTPHKTFFNSAYSGSKAMVTDSTNYYPKNNHSYFDVVIRYTNNNFIGYGFFLDIKHRFDTDTLKDGGYISVSWNKGKTFCNIIKDSIPNANTGYSNYYMYPKDSTFGYLQCTKERNLYNGNQKLFNGECGFSGKSKGWITTNFRWYNLAVKRNLDTVVILRFNFISDSINNNKEGWEIDNIRYYSLDMGGGVIEKNQNKNHANIYNNGNYMQVSLDKNYNNTNYQIIDIKGNIISKSSILNSDNFEINKNKFPTGLYLLIINFNDNTSETLKFIIN